MIQKSTRLQRQEIPVRLKYQDLISARLQKEGTTSIQGNQRWVEGLPQYRCRRRIECHGHQTSGMTQNRPPSVQKTLMAEVNTIKIADRQAQHVRVPIAA